MSCFRCADLFRLTRGNMLIEDDPSNVLVAVRALIATWHDVPYGWIAMAITGTYIGTSECGHGFVHDISVLVIGTC